MAVARVLYCAALMRVSGPLSQAAHDATLTGCKNGASPGLATIEKLLHTVMSTQMQLLRPHRVIECPILVRPQCARRAYAIRHVQRTRYTTLPISEFSVAFVPARPLCHVLQLLTQPPMLRHNPRECANVDRPLRDAAARLS